MLGDWVGSLSGLLIRQSCRLCFAIRQGPGLSPTAEWAVVWALWLGGVAGCALRLPRITVQAPWSCKARG